MAMRKALTKSGGKCKVEDISMLSANYIALQ
jgi:hypothetical protein